MTNVRLPEVNVELSKGLKYYWFNVCFNYTCTSFVGMNFNKFKNYDR